MDATFWAALFGIIWIDLLLSGDNAVVIAMVSRQLPPEQQRKTIIFGTLAAIGLRIGLAFIAGWLMGIWGLSLMAGLYLMWVAYGLIVHGAGHDEDRAPAMTFWGAVGTIAAADVGMSLDNILAIAALSHGHWILMALGVLISIPMIIAFSVAISSLIDRYPALKWVGAAVLAWAAGGIIAGDPLLTMIPLYDAGFAHWFAGILSVILVIGSAWAMLELKKPAHTDLYETGF
ncbi:TerC family protein [uncultured Methylobacterium sp.]|jgi:YjbE family integral membrane protein|uniref:TerC family protein n=1 Tax=uncultured Methylobacterium sp. TaxID=157278 RepID=UPI0026300718|nr:TerC family protein [uncultured Methylobacterium sp.]